VVSRARTGSPASPAVLAGKLPLSAKVVPPLVDWANPVKRLTPPTLDPESLKATTRLLPEPSTIDVSLWVSWEVVSAAVLLTSTLATEGTARSSRTSRVGRVVDGRQPRPARAGAPGRRDRGNGLTAGSPLLISVGQARGKGQRSTGQKSPSVRYSWHRPSSCQEKSDPRERVSPWDGDRAPWPSACCTTR